MIFPIWEIKTSISYSFQLYCEVAHQRSLPCYTHTMSDLLPSVIDILQRCSDYCHMVVCIYSARNSQAQEIKSTKTVLSGHRVTVSKQITDLTSTDSCLEIKLYGKSLCRELLFWNVCQHLWSINEKSMASCRTLVRNMIFVEVWRLSNSVFSSRPMARAFMSRPFIPPYVR